MNSPDEADITIPQLKSILDFLMRTPQEIHHIGLLGGEPLMHPYFDDIYNYIKQYFQNQNMEMQVAIITNGIHLINHLDICNNSIIKINVNDPQIIGEENWNKLRQGILALKDNNDLELGINLFPGMTNYNFIFELANEINVNNIKCGYTAPVTEQQKFNNRFDYYRNGKKLFLDFCQSAVNNGITLGLDCNCIPKCMFTEEELVLLEEAEARPLGWCYPAIDIMPDLTVSSCFNFPNTQNLLDFNDMKEIENYFLQNYSEPKARNRTECQLCELYSDTFGFSRCQGGCFGFNE